MGVVIENIEYFLPETIVSNADLLIENPGWDMQKVSEKTGVYRRHIAGRNETAFDLAVAACNKIFLTFDKKKLDAVIFCTQSPDYIMPPNSYLLHKQFDLNERILAFDINQACSGFIYGLFLARSLILSGSGENILLVNADTYSKYIHKNDRSTRSLFGDGASASIINKDDLNKGIIDCLISSSGKGYESFYIPAGGCRMTSSSENISVESNQNGNIHSLRNIHMNGMAVLSFFRNKVTGQVKELLLKNSMTVNDVDLFVFHQASKIALDSIAAALKIPEKKMYSNLGNIGNLVSASVPVALKMAMDEKRLKRGDRIIISGFGVGLSWGSMLVVI